MAETEVSKEVCTMVAIEDKCGLDMGSYQDLPKLDSNGSNHHNQANDLDNSYVFVTGADDLPDSSLDNKGVVSGGSGVPPQPEDSQHEILGEVSEEAHHLNEGENGKVEQMNGNAHPVDYNTFKHESFHEDGKGVQVSVALSGEVNTCKTDSLPEPDQVFVADAQEVHTGKNESVAEANVQQIEDSNGKTESMLEGEVEKAVDQNGEFEGMAEGEQQNLDGFAIAESPPCPVKNQEPQVGALDLVAEIGENRESDNIFSNINGSRSPNDGEIEGNTNVTEAVEHQRPQDVAVDEDGSSNSPNYGEIESNTNVTEAVEHQRPQDVAVDEDGSSNSPNYGEIESNTNVTEAVEHQRSQDVAVDEDGSSNSPNDGENDCNKSASETVEHQDVVADEDENELQNVCVEAGDEAKPTKEVAEAAEHEVSTSTDLRLDPESFPVNSADKTLEEEAKTDLSLDVLESKQGDSGADKISQDMVGETDEVKSVLSSTHSHVLTTYDLVSEENNHLSVSEIEDGAKSHEESRGQPVVSSTDPQVLTTSDLVLEENEEGSPVSEVEHGDQYCGESQEQSVARCTDSYVQTTRDLVLEEKEDDASVSEVENDAQYPEESQEQHDDHRGALLGIGSSKTLIEASVKIPDALQSETEVSDVLQSETEVVSDVEEIGKVSSPSVGPESQSIEQVVPGHDSAMRYPLDEASSGSHCVPDTVFLEKDISFEGGEAPFETDVLSGNPEVGESSPETLDVKLESGGHVPDFPAMVSGEMTDDVAVSSRSEISDSCNVSLESAVNLELGVNGVEDVGDQLGDSAGHSEENFLVPNTEDSQNEETSVSLAGVSTTKIPDGEDKSIKTKTKPFNFLIRTPRFDDENLREQIRLAKLQVDEKTKLRDAIQLQIQEKRASSQIHGIDYEHAKNEGRSARKLVRSKRTEIDSLQSVINKAKNALSIEDIDNQIQNMEHMIQHETLPLKEEKQFIREIKQLKQLREQLSSNMGSLDEIKEALQQREEIEQRLKILRKELDVLKSSVLKAEAAAAEAGKRYDDENRMVKELQAQFRAANEVRQEAYARWQNLRKELSKKSEYFFKYKDDAAIASNYAFSRDTEALYCLCTNQVESFMELWNLNPEFRRDYIKFNERSNVRRFGTLDCRSLGPDEKPPALPSYAYDRGNRMASTPAKLDLAPQIPSAEQNQKTPSENMTSDSKSSKKVIEPKNLKASNVPAITAHVNGSDTHTATQLTGEVHEEPIKSREEIESIRKAEERRREEAEAKLKEQRRLEALAKANEARERKKRQAEKLQQRAELKTQKEAEQREKEREKRLRKKERKKAAGTDGNDSNNNCDTAASSESAAENSKEIEVKERVSKKSQKPWLGAKQSKAKSIPPPLRNRNKKKLQQWMWVGMTSFVILVLFWMGNVGMFSNVALKRRAPVY